MLSSYFEFGFWDIALSIGLLYFIYIKFIRKEPEEEVVKMVQPLQKQDMTIEQLKKYNGVDDEHLCFAIFDKIYEVTKAAHFYGPPDGPYKNLAGRDATISLGTMDTNKIVDGINDISTMTPEQIETAEDWASKLSMKYPVVGNLLKE
uniref:Cytochrome b5 heme-binding domain-containing protein n=1 Tax=Rhabditophanes sp. KR3021 TaxID=114890 RepID=A0AC35TNG6_9BILA